MLREGGAGMLLIYGCLKEGGREGGREEEKEGGREGRRNGGRREEGM